MGVYLCGCVEQRSRERMGKRKKRWFVDSYGCAWMCIEVPGDVRVCLMCLDICEHMWV
jgi:hypothetical protein